MRRLLIVRPEPGASASAAQARSIGLDPVICPLFSVEPVGWIAPDPVRFDGLLLTSANALRHGGGGLERLRALPVLAVGGATAEAAVAAGFSAELVGSSSAQELLDVVPGERQLLHLAGQHHGVAEGRHRVETIPVYRAATISDPDLPDLDGMAVAVHSPRAGARLAELADDRATIVVAAISPAAARACGVGWEALEAADRPTDAALLALAARLCQSPLR